MGSLHHYTDDAGFKGIAAAPKWRFLACKPPGDHPPGAYFTDYERDTPNLAMKLRIPASKLEWYFEFVDVGDLVRIPGQRGDHIFYSPTAYQVDEPRQVSKGKTER